MINLQFTSSRILAVAALLLPHHATAQNYPVKPIRILVGPGPDVIARTFAQKFTMPGASRS